MSKITCIIVDDEPLAIEILEEYAAKIPELDLRASFDSAIEALGFLKRQTVDVVFLDIQMPDLTGLQMADLIQGQTNVIFTTAYSEFAVEGFELEAKDYLLKPISFQRFVKAIDRIGKMRSSKSVENEEGHIFVKSEYKLQKIRLNDILFVEGMKDYLRIVTPHSKVMTLLSFAKLESMLPKGRLMRIHKSYMIALDKIDSVEKGKVNIGKHSIPIGETYREIFYEKITRPEV